MMTMWAKTLLVAVLSEGAQAFLATPCASPLRLGSRPCSACMCGDGVPSLREQMKAYIESQKARGVPLTKLQKDMIAEFEQDEELLEQTGRIDFTKGGLSGTGTSTPAAAPAAAPSRWTPPAVSEASADGRQAVNELYGIDSKEGQQGPEIDPVTGTAVRSSSPPLQFGDAGYGERMGGKQRLPVSAPPTTAPLAAVPPPPLQGIDPGYILAVPPDVPEATRQLWATQAWTGQQQMRERAVELLEERLDEAVPLSYAKSNELRSALATLIATLSQA